MAEARAAEGPASVEQVMAFISAAINTRALYAPGHPRVGQAIRRVVELLNLLAERTKRDSVTFLVIGDELLIDQKPMRTGSPLQVNFIQTLRRRKVQRLTVAHGLDQSELIPFIESMISGEIPRSSAHLIVGQVATAADEEDKVDATRQGFEGPSAESRDASELKRTLEMLGGRAENVKDAFARIRAGQTESLGRLDSLVWGLIEAFARSSTGTLPLATLQAYDDRTFVHSVNVCILTLLQARGFGFQGPVLHALGTAALLHDIGKLFVPLPILNQPGRLSDDDWSVMKTHAQIGSWYLSGLETSAPLSILVAFEHHLRYDGGPSYPSLRTPRRPTLASQMTAVADAYESMVSLGPDQKEICEPAAVEILRRRAGSFYDPLIVANFLQLLSAVGAN